MQLNNILPAGRFEELFSIGKENRFKQKNIFDGIKKLLKTEIIVSRARVQAFKAWMDGEV